MHQQTDSPNLAEIAKDLLAQLEQFVDSDGYTSYLSADEKKAEPHIKAARATIARAKAFVPLIGLELGAWSQTPPHKPGRYWVWQDEGAWPCRGVVHLVEAELQQGVLRAWVPYMDYADAVVCTGNENTWLEAWWLGPVVVPQAPNAGIKPRR